MEKTTEDSSETPIVIGSRVRVRRFGADDFAEKNKGRVVHVADNGIIYVYITVSETSTFMTQQVYGFATKDVQLIPDAPLPGVLSEGCEVNIPLQDFVIRGTVDQIHPDGFVVVAVHTSNCLRFHKGCTYILLEKDLELVEETK